MKNRVRLLSPLTLACVILGVASHGTQTACASDSVAMQTAEVEAELVLREYFSAIRSGSASKLRDISGEPLRSKFGDHLNHPAYRANIVKTYKGAKFSLIASPVVQADYVQATVEITLETSERIRERITLTRDPLSHRMMLIDVEAVPLDTSDRSAE
ncbi:MAG: hypothetical protein KFB96_07680 [Thiocapsa sp.]|uniref:hypothetical protein n=1 Tax=Thiocapsa sp. TaxID=2024551 RepID=UPI001BCEE34D|nr:hypothetical protein [Thiocapsa sp.]QVL50306.1 MAG: hypothetical protein KFB96_07680 [Thiocapsa sp.]